jgi:PAS domain S-box-containing protein
MTMRKWLTPPVYEEEYQTFASRVLHWTLLLFITIMVVALAFITSLEQLIFFPPVFALFGLCYYLLHTHQYRTACWFFLGGLWLVITVAIFSLNGIRNSSFSTYAVVIIFAAILFADREVLIFTVLSILSGAALFFGEMGGLLPLNTSPLYLPDRFFQNVTLFVAAGVMLSAAARVIRGGVTHLREHQQLLEERNLALENEILERQRAEAALRASEEKYRLLIENASMMVGVYDQDGKILLFNTAAAAMFGTTPQAVQGRTLYDLVDTKDAEGDRLRREQVIATGKPDISEGVITFPNGREIHYLRNMMPLPALDTGGKPQVLVITTDITERIQSEQRSRELALAQQKNAFLTEFFSIVSHDLKTPLTVMNTSLYLLERLADPAQRQVKMEQMKEQVALLDRYIQDMLTVSRLEYLPQLNKVRVDIGALLQEVIDLLRPRLEKKNITCSVRVQEAACAVAGDPEQLHRALVNLVENAISYTPPGGWINVSMSLTDTSLLLEVADTGIGISPEDLPHIFDRFYRSSEARQLEEGGSGLGLAIVQKIIALHQATITVESHLGQGTTFRIHFSRLS